MNSLIGKSIGQTKPFDNVFHKVLVSLKYTASRIANWQTNFFEPYGITPQQFNILRILRGAKGKPLSVSDLKARMIDENSDVSRLIDRLLRLELVERQVGASDRRFAQVTISPQGLELLADIDPRMSEMYHTLFQNVTEEQAEQVNIFLNKIIEDTKA